MNDLIRMNIHELNEQGEEQVKTILPARYERALKYAHEDDRKRCLAAGLLLIRHLNIQDEGKILYGQFGKPYLADGPEFNLAHSGDWVVLAVSDVPVGIDIERIGNRNVKKLARSFPEAEFGWLQEGENPSERFYTLWTMKESVMKATGRGLNLDPRSFSVMPALEGENIKIEGKAFYPESFTFDDYVLSVCREE